MSDAARKAFARDGHILVDVNESAAWSETLEQQRLALEAAGAGNRPWAFWELHNPWSRAAANIDSWQVLDICQSEAMIALLAPLIGADIVLFDSQIVPNPALAEFRRSQWRCDKEFFPTNGHGGIVVRVPFGSDQLRKVDFHHPESVRVEYTVGQVLLHAAGARYRTGDALAFPASDYVIRYFPATVCFSRDPLNSKHIALTNKYPWVNYTKMPLWLVSGEDRASNDFVTGFHTKPGRWTSASAGIRS